ncbi:DUF4400 domain-containing protein [Salmonella enterica]|nr:DUF4400 domain-containing protein [Salmonella enterica]EBV4140681.1 hypothetical protein [Salmonella enterica subsp. enterica serovar Benin]ECB0725473.1 DUF4400 domain-containing protein [Salmonella enterica subsp. enterica serovar Noya]ECB3741769.1 DUF4400 domain-containing protein [Salmonella enterica subsp. enterica serovar Akanji]EBE6988645.1 DUF4400 domain-containing protein [Salmonella enterica]
MEAAQYWPDVGGKARTVAGETGKSHDRMAKLVYKIQYSCTNSETIPSFINQQSHLRIRFLPALKNRIAIGLAGKVVCQNLWLFDTGHESGFVYHHARRMIPFSLIATGLMWLAVPQFLDPKYFWVPSSVIVGLALSFAIGAFKKYF